MEGADHPQATEVLHLVKVDLQDKDHLQVLEDHHQVIREAQEALEAQELQEAAHHQVILSIVAHHQEPQVVLQQGDLQVKVALLKITYLEIQILLVENECT
jgi:putative NADH-flavin reductase